MAGTICLPTFHLLIIFCIFIGFTAIYIQYNKNKNSNDPDYDYEDRILNKLVKKINKEKEPSPINEFAERRQYLNNRDANALYNDLVAPERRVPEYLYPFNYVKEQINIPTRGYPENYQILGVLLRDDTETAYKLFGRQTYPGSDMWEYYCENDKYNNVKLPLQSRGNKELMDGMHVHVPGTDKNKGEFKVKLYNFDVPRYIPVL
jgi:hypothetical protein